MTIKLLRKESENFIIIERIGKVEFIDAHILLTNYSRSGNVQKLHQYRLDLLEYFEVLP